MIVDRHAPLDQLDFAFLDVETTGLDPALGDRVCEIAILRCQAGDPVDSLQYLVNPQRPMGAGALRVHGISDAMVSGAPVFAEICEDVLATLDGAVMVGHNAPFDFGFLLEEFSRSACALPPLVIVDTLRLARRTLSANSYSLSSLTTQLGINIAGRGHRAMVDVLATKALFEMLTNRLSQAGVSNLSQLVQAQGGPLRIRRAEHLDLPGPILAALGSRQMLWLRYRSENGVISERFVRPIRAFRREGRDVLLAHCMLRDARRTFRIDRILESDVVQDD